tara:strand:+ start:226 stop:537 length:312 start_codon:yes stop_codon:yes gene_type:complete
MDFSNDIMVQIGQDVIYRRAHDAVVLNIEQMGCEWEELREPYGGKVAGFVGFVDYLIDEPIEWMPDFEWGDINHGVGWNTWETEKGRQQVEDYLDFWSGLDYE